MGADGNAPPAVQLKGVTKHFGKIIAVHKIDLNIHGQAVSQPTGIYFFSVQSFGLEDDLMALSVGKPNNFIFKRWAVPGRYPFYLSAVKR